MQSGASALDFSAMAAMTFEAIDAPGHQRRFPGLRLAWQALEGPPGTPGILNAANEVAVAAFLEQRIRFDQIYRINEETMAAVQATGIVSMGDLLALDGEARAAASSIAMNLAR